MTGPGRMNPLLLADSYKVSHHLQYPPGTTTVFSYFESRGGKWDRVLFFGLQYILKRYLVGPVVTQQMIDEAEELFQQHFSNSPGPVFNRAGWEHILNKHGGKLPVRIRAVPEGEVVPVRNVLFTVENTDPAVPWLTNYLETLLVQVWYPTTVATNSFHCRAIIADWLDKTADSLDGLEYKLHDFGYRGVSSVESAGLGGAAHLLSFSGTDTLAGLVVARDYYGAARAAGHSIPATEHSTMTSWGRAGEEAAIRHITHTIPGGLAIVVDSYDIWAALELLGTELRAGLEAREGFLVVRPDSGDPAAVLVRVFNILGEKFGWRENSKGYKELPGWLRVLQGDGVSHDTLGGILAAVAGAGWSTAGLGFGSGGALLQRLDRDTQRCAYKCSWAEVEGRGREVFKDPVTDPGKRSKAGRLALVRDAETGQYSTVKEEERGEREDRLVTVMEDGALLQDWTWEQVLNRARSQS